VAELNFTASHSEQVEALVAPIERLDLPASQSEQEDAPVVELNFPGSQKIARRACSTARWVELTRAARIVAVRIGVLIGDGHAARKA